MAEAAARMAVERAGLNGSDIDAVLLATFTYPYQTPAAAAIVAHRVGATPAAALDISAACAGFCYALSLASDMVRGGSARNVLVIGAEKLSDFTDPTDRGSAFIFGDGAGAVVVGPERPARHRPHDLGVGRRPGAGDHEQVLVGGVPRRPRTPLAVPDHGRPDRLPVGRVADVPGGAEGDRRGRYRHR